MMFRSQGKALTVKWLKIVFTKGKFSVIFFQSKNPMFSLEVTEKIKIM